MKSKIVFLALLLAGSFAQAQLSGEKTGDVYEVIAVSCKSGAAVNHRETSNKGDSMVLTTDFIQSLERSGNRLVLNYPINSKGFEYASKSPPCPTGDVLIIEFVKVGDIRRVGVEGAKAARLYDALKAAGAPVESYDESESEAVVEQVKCEKTTEKQQGDPGAKAESLQLYECNWSNAEKAPEYAQAQELLRSLLGAGLKLSRANIDGILYESVAAIRVSCRLTRESQQGDPDATPEVLELTSCELSF